MADSFSRIAIPAAARVVVLTASALLVLALSAAFLPGSRASVDLSRDCVAKQVEELHQRVGRGEAIVLDPQRLALLTASIDDSIAETLTAYCYTMGIADTTLIDHWPSYSIDDKLVLPPGLEHQRDMISAILAKSTWYAQSNFQALKPLPIHIFVGNAFKPLAIQAENLGIGPEEISGPMGKWHRYCGLDGFVAGYANAYRMVVCVPVGNDGFDFADTDHVAKLTETFAHEYFHNFQLQVSGVRGGGGYRADPVFGIPGPAWLLEGTAKHVGLSLATDRKILRQQYARTVSDYGYSQEDRCRILKRQEASFEATSGPRAVALLAVMDLEDKAGSDSFARFYGSVGLTLDWRASFEKVYGDTPEVVLGCADRG